MLTDSWLLSFSCFYPSVRAFVTDRGPPHPLDAWDGELMIDHIVNLHPRIRLGRLVSPPFLYSFLYPAERTAVHTHSGEGSYSCSDMGKKFINGSRAGSTKGFTVTQDRHKNCYVNPTSTNSHTTKDGCSNSRQNKVMTTPSQSRKGAGDVVDGDRIR